MKLNKSKIKLLRNIMKDSKKFKKINFTNIKFIPSVVHDIEHYSTIFTDEYIITYIPNLLESMKNATGSYFSKGTFNVRKKIINKILLGSDSPFLKEMLKSIKEVHLNFDNQDEFLRKIIYNCSLEKCLSERLYIDDNIIVYKLPKNTKEVNFEDIEITDKFYNEMKTIRNSNHMFRVNTETVKSLYSSDEGYFYVLDDFIGYTQNLIVFEKTIDSIGTANKETYLYREDDKDLYQILDLIKLVNYIYELLKKRQK